MIPATLVSESSVRCALLWMASGAVEMCGDAAEKLALSLCLSPAGAFAFPPEILHRVHVYLRYTVY